MSKTKTVEAVECVEVTFVTGYPDRDERRYSSATCFGPFQRVRKGEEGRFVSLVTRHLKKTGKDHRVREVRIEPCGLQTAKDVPSGDSAITSFCKYLDDESNW